MHFFSARARVCVCAVAISTRCAFGADMFTMMTSDKLHTFGDPENVSCRKIDLFHFHTAVNAEQVIAKVNRANQVSRGGQHERNHSEMLTLIVSNGYKILVVVNCFIHRYYKRHTHRRIYSTYVF